MSNEKIANAVGLLLVVIAGVFIANQFNVTTTFGTIGVGDAYKATTTSTGTFAPHTTIRTGPGEFGCVILTGAAASQILILDATTTNATLRDASQATSTLRLLDIPISTAAGTYCADTTFTRGLTVSFIGASGGAGTMATTTITWR